MGCINCKNNLDEELIIEKLIENRRNFLESNEREYKEKVIVNDKLSKIYQSEFYKDINNEVNLLKYLNSIKEEKDIFDYELLLYFDVLSKDNKIKYTGISNFISSIEIFENLIDLLSECDNLQEIKNFVKSFFDISGREKFILSKNFTLNYIKNNFIKKEKDDNETLLKRKKQMLTFSANLMIYAGLQIFAVTTLNVTRLY